MKVSSKNPTNLGGKEVDELLQEKLVQYYRNVLGKPNMHRAAKTKIPTLKNLIFDEVIFPPTVINITTKKEAQIIRELKELPEEKWKEYIGKVVVIGAGKEFSNDKGVMTKGFERGGRAGATYH